MEQQNSNPNTTPQDPQQDPYDPRNSGRPYSITPGEYDSRRGKYMSEASNIFKAMLDERVFMDLLDDTQAAFRKWNFDAPIKSYQIQWIKNLSSLKDLSNTTPAAADKEILDKSNTLIDKYHEANELYKFVVTKYKAAVLLLDDQPLQNKELIQIITLYYFVTHDIDVFDKDPLTDEQRADLIATAQEMDQVYTNAPSVNQKYYLAPDYANIPQEFTEAREFFAYFPFISHYCCCKEFSDLPLDETTQQQTAKPPEQLALPFMQTYRPNAYIVPNNTLMNAMEKYDCINNEFDLEVFKDKPDTTTYVAISYEPDPESGIKVTGPEKLSPYLRMLSNAVISLFITGKEQGQDKPIVSDEMINRATPGAGDKLSPQQKAALTKGLDKLRSMYVVIDATDELRAKKKIGPKETFKIDGNYLMATRVECKLQNGRITHAYRIEAEPLIYTYAKATRQLCSIPTKCLDIRQIEKGAITDKAVRMTKEKQVISDILLRRIAIMKQDAKHKKQKQSHTILFSTLFETADLANLSRDREMDYRKFVFAVLDYQAAIEYIKGYKKQTKGRAITGIEIKL